MLRIFIFNKFPTAYIFREVENEFLYNELEYLIKKVEGLIAEDVNFFE